MSRYYSDEQLDRIKRALPRCVYLRESKKGLLSFLVRITLANGQKKPLVRFQPFLMLRLRWNNTTAHRSCEQ